LAQSRATDPGRSAWVSANAGSGKTFVLSRRVIRLLLAGTAPSKILCLTFTKAAAAEMARRVFDELGRWTRLPEAALSKEIEKLKGRPPTTAQVSRARRLFAAALDAPGGLRIQTIHAFCERLLHQFPFEANVAGHFEVLDERNAAALKDEARRALLTRAAADPHGRLGRALDAVLGRVSDYTHETTLDEFIAKRDAVRAWIQLCGDVDGAIADLRRALGLADGETSDALRRSIVADCPLDGAPAARLLAALSGSARPKDREAAARLLPFVESRDEIERADAWAAFLLKHDGEPRTAPVTKDVLAALPGIDRVLAGEAARLAALADRVRTAELAETSAAMLLLADGAIGAYEAEKRRRGVLDFEDLIVRTALLLARSDAVRWVQYKLDRGIEHVLVDEAQDTSPRQWQVIERLVAEFFAGEGSSAALRTLFAVGDEKQSIYSFQGAVPARFAVMRDLFATRAGEALLAFEGVRLHLSFRSVPKILAAVDAVFASAEVHRGLSTEPEPTVHSARRHGEPGRVILWPRCEQPAKPEADDWVKPLDHLGVASPEVRLARRIARTVRGWIDRRETLDAPDAGSRPRPIDPGSILILTRSRGALTDAINRELKNLKVPIAGADRITLGEHIAVMDLMALARVVLLPEDDLSLAALLKSPLIGLDEDQLYALAHDRPASLWHALEAAAARDPAFAPAKARLDRWRARADLVDPHAFFAGVLGPDGGRRAFLARLGAEAEDVLDEFLAEALTYGQANVASLQGFIAWLEEAEVEVRRDPDAGRPEVRVMTVHGAKGLEADVVFLVDNGTPANIASYVDRVVPLSPERDPDRPGPVVWMRGVAAMPGRILERIDDERRLDEEEYRRLLYVGMTRARDRLYVVGLQKQKVGQNKLDMRWHPIVERALAGGFTERVLADGEIELEWQADAEPVPVPAAAPPVAERVQLPAWAARDASPPPAAARRLAPSSALPDEPPLRIPPRRDGAAAMALERGRLVHRLLQSLPDMPAARRADVAGRYLATAAPEWPEAERAALVAEVLAVLADPAFAAAFAPGSRAEVEIAGRVGATLVAGRIDRLAVTEGRVLVVDYKTNRPAPAGLAEVPRSYVGQLAVYRAILARLYPGRVVSAGLLWTDRPSLMEIPEAALILAESEIVSGRAAPPNPQG
ncbi:MAG TPA: double-strand break repair helicase AddA, partial [Bauldia sp.]|nr:double-strand break repair helicase AddA [Bauldia sp.]